MKTTLFFSIIFFSLFNSQTWAQPCSISNVQIVSTSGNCTATISFDMDRNNGNKYIYLHIWNAQDYGEINKSRFQSGSGPLKADIDGASNNHPSLTTVAINNTDINNPVISNKGYRPDNTVTTVTGYQVTVSPAPVSGSGNNALYRYTVSNIPLGTNVAGGCNTTNLGVVVWSTQSNSQSPHIHCSSMTPAQSLNNLVVTGSGMCVTGSYTIRLINNSTVPYTVNVDVFADNGSSGDDGIFDPGALLTNDSRFRSYNNYSIPAQTTVVISGNIPGAYLGYNLWAQVIVLGGGTKVQFIPVSACSTLPVDLLSFEARRKNDKVELTWQTGTEQNIRGFAVQRLTEKDVWEKVGFVLAQGNNSIYRFTDNNVLKGVTQYRLQEEQVNGSKSFSAIRFVAGMNATTKMTVYPNPVVSGPLNIVFADSHQRDVLITDATGRQVKQYRNYNNSRLQVDGLQPGMYQLQAMDRATGEIEMHKVIVSK